MAVAVVTVVAEMLASGDAMAVAGVMVAVAEDESETEAETMAADRVVVVRGEVPEAEFHSTQDSCATALPAQLECTCHTRD